MGAWRSTLLALCCACAPVAWAQPKPGQVMDDAILRSANSGYHFQTLSLDSADGQRHYQLWVGKPDQAPPASGYPVLYMLDGNAALGGLKPDALQALSHKASAPVLVAVGYAGHQRIDRTGRTLDYTPGPARPDPLTQQPSGGADAFLDLMEQRIKPAVAERVKSDPRQQTLWGHSYGGLLVLHALLSRPHSFQHFAAASPSLWWLGPERLAAAQQGFQQRLKDTPTSLLLMRGEAEPAAPRSSPTTTAADNQAVQALLDNLHQVKGLTVEYKPFPGLGHGPMLDASLEYLLQSM